MALMCTPPLWAKALRPHVWELGIGQHVRGLRNEGRERGQQLQVCGSDAPPHLEGEVGDDGAQVGIACSLPESIDGSLHHPGTGRNRGQGVGDGQLPIVVRMDAGGDVEALADLLHHLIDEGGQRPAIGVAEDEPIGSRRGSGLQHIHCIICIVGIAIEEVFGVEHHLAAVGLEERYTVPDKLQILLQRDLQRVGHVKVPALAEDGHAFRSRFQYGLQVRVLRGSGTCPAGAPERGKAGVLQLKLGGGLEEGGVLGIGPGPAPFDVVHPEMVELLQDVQLVLGRK